MAAFFPCGAFSGVSNVPEDRNDLNPLFFLSWRLPGKFAMPAQHALASARNEKRVQANKGYSRHCPYKNRWITKAPREIL